MESSTKSNAGWIALFATLTVMIVGVGIYFFSNYTVTLDFGKNSEEAEETEEVVVEDSFTNEAVILYSEEIDQIDSKNRGWPVVDLWLKNEASAPILLASGLGKVGEYFHQASFAPDNKRVFVDLEKKLQVIDLATKRLEDFYVAKYGVQSFAYSKDKKKMLVFDQDYANPDTKYAVVEIDVASGEAKTLYEGDTDGAFYFIQAWSDDGYVVLMQALGEAGHTKLLNLKDGKISEIPGIEGALWGNSTDDGKYILAVEETIDSVCNEMIGSAPSIWNVIDPLTGKVVDQFGQAGLAAYMEFNSPSEDEILYSVTDLPKNYDNCDDDREKFYFKQTVGAGIGSATEVASRKDVALEYGIKDGRLLQTKYVDDWSTFQILKDGKVIFEFDTAEKKNVLDMRVE